MSQWIKKLPLSPIYLCFLLVWLYFAIYSGERLAYLGLDVYKRQTIFRRIQKAMFTGLVGLVVLVSQVSLSLS